MSDQPSTEVIVSLNGGMNFEARGEDNIAVAMDASSGFGGDGTGLRPMEVLLGALGGCMAMDVISILRKKRQDITGYRVEISGVQAREHPKVFTKIAMRHVFEGTDITEEAVKRSIELSETKYCPAYAMLTRVVPISSAFEIEAPVPAD